MSAILNRGDVVRKELRCISRRAKVFFKDAPQSDSGDEFRKFLRERYGLFGVRLQSMIGIFEVACDTHEEWSKAVFLGEEEFDQKDEAAIRSLFSQWLEVAETFMQRAEFYGRHGIQVHEKLTKLRIYVERAAAILRDWKRPGLSLSPSLLTRQLSPENEAKLKEQLAKRTAVSSNGTM